MKKKMLRVARGRFPSGIENERPLFMVEFKTTTHKVRSITPRFSLTFDHDYTRWVASFNEDNEKLVGFVRREDDFIRLDCVDDPEFWMELEFQTT